MDGKVGSEAVWVCGIKVKSAMDGRVGSEAVNVQGGCNQCHKPVCASYMLVSINVKFLSVLHSGLHISIIYFCIISFAVWYRHIHTNTHWLPKCHRSTWSILHNLWDIPSLQISQCGITQVTPHYTHSQTQQCHNTSITSTNILHIPTVTSHRRPLPSHEEWLVVSHVPESQLWRGVQAWTHHC